MGWHSPWVSGADHGSDPPCVHKDWPHPKKEVQVCPNFRTVREHHTREGAEDICFGSRRTVGAMMMLMIKHMTDSMLVQFQNQCPSLEPIICRFRTRRVNGGWG